MKTPSIFNHVLGPVMRGPSSSHTAGAFHIASMARSLLNDWPQRAVLAFDPRGSYAATYVEQGADRGFAMGLMGQPLTERSFFTALEDAASAGLAIEFQVRTLPNPDHPNTVAMDLTAANGNRLTLTARSIGGGEVEITSLNDHPVLFDGSAFEIAVRTTAEHAETASRLLAMDGQAFGEPHRELDGSSIWLCIRRRRGLPESIRQALLDLNANFWESHPVYFVQTGETVFSSAAEIVQMAEQGGMTLGELSLTYESRLLGISEAEVMTEILRRYEIMVSAVQQGLAREFSGLQLLPPCASQIFRAEEDGLLATQSLHTRAAARSLAVMHVNGAMGVVCAAPTGGSAGVLPGTLVTLAEQRSLGPEQIAKALLAAGAIGVILAKRATFAAEVAGCQVEIGAAGAMAAAAVVDAVGGTARQCCDAAAISLQNTMGSVCDLLHGMVEVPCHTRNAAAAAAAFVNADLILGGYPNLIPLDETIDAVYAVGRAMPPELRCTSQGGLAIAPSAQAMKPGCCDPGCGERSV